LANAYFLAENIKAGSIYINEATSCWDEMAPFGGVKRSGVGRMLSDWIFNELSEIKMILFDLGKVKKQ
jgi:acyl-CoA reductase-like NAD-dependent aldehyde dehydrogenase